MQILVLAIPLAVIACGPEITLRASDGIGGGSRSNQTIYVNCETSRDSPEVALRNPAAYGTSRSTHTAA